MPQKLDVNTWIRQRLPADPGSWALALEPALIALIVRGTAGAISGSGALLVFLGLQPFTLGAGDLLKKERGGCAWLSLALGVLLMGEGFWILATQFWEMMTMVAVLAAFYVVLDLKAPPREISKELIGSLIAFPAALFAFPGATLPLIVRPLAVVLSVRGALGQTQDAIACRWWGAALAVPLIFLSFRPFGPLHIAYCLVGIRAVFLALTLKWERSPARLAATEALVSLAVLSFYVYAALNRH